MANVRARNLPRVREALEKAERARFYKQRTNKYTDEVRLMNSLTGLENQRIAALARIKEQTMDLRMQALHIKEEEEAFLKADTVGFDELKRKVEINKHRNFLQEVKYKPRRIRDDFVRRYERWKALDAKEDDWRFEMPTRQPQVRLNEQLIYPAKRERKQNFRQYLEAMQRILGQIESTRRSIKFWEIPASQWTREKLDECHQRRRYRVRRRKQNKPEVKEDQQPDKEVAEDDDETVTQDEGSLEDGGKVRFRQSNRRQMKKKSMMDPQSDQPTATGSDEDSTSAATAGDDNEEGQRERVRKLSKRLSRDFRSEDFNKHRQSLIQELDEEGVSPQERLRRMREFEKAWAEVLKCKYIRGYEPPDMRLPEGQTATDFVFGEAEARALDKIVEEAAASAETTEIADRPSDIIAVDEIDQSAQENDEKHPRESGIVEVGDDENKDDRR
uniref:Uncharacterized protein n=1 Tax=Macrostomum lignano TaxID=282301 RepID=A0A1I8IKN0_9PLAT